MGRTIEPPKPIGGVQIVATPEDFSPSRSDMKVVGAFNPGVTRITEGSEEKMLLLVRKAEAFVEPEPDDPAMRIVRAPHFPVTNCRDSPFRIEADNYPISEISGRTHKEIRFKNRTPDRLLHISYPAVCVLDQNGKIERIEDPAGLRPVWEHERFGTEDLRCTRRDPGEEIELGGERFEYVITYVLPHRTHGVSTGVALTNNFKEFVRVSPSPNETPRAMFEGKDIVFFPRRIHKEGIDGQMRPMEAALTRPSSFPNISRPDICLSFGTDVTSVGSFPYRLVESKGDNISGPGPAPLELKDEGIWLTFYHQVQILAGKPIYRTAMLGLNLERPWEVVYKSKPFIQPNEHARGKSFVADVNYVTGAEFRDKGRLVETVFGENDECSTRRVYETARLVKFLKQG